MSETEPTHQPTSQLPASSTQPESQSNEPIKVEETVNLQVSQFGQSVSSSGIEKQLHEDSKNAIHQTHSERLETRFVESQIAKSETGSFILTSQKAENISNNEGSQTKVQEAKYTQIEAPSSPKRQRSENNEAIQLSPRLTSRRSASPAVSRGKLQTVNKMLIKQEERTSELEGKFNELAQKKADLEKSLIERHISYQNQRQKDQEQTRLKNKQQSLKKLIEQKQTELNQIRINKIAHQRSHQTKIQQITAENQKLRQRNQDKKKEIQEKKREYEAELHNAKLLQQVQAEKLALQQSQKTRIQAERELIGKKISELKVQKAAAQEKLNLARKAKEQKLTNEKKAKEQLEKKIAQIKEKINNKKNELSSIKNQTHNDLKRQHEAISHQVSALNGTSQSLVQSNKKLEEDIQKKAKQSTESKEVQKKKEKKIIDLTKKYEDLTKKVQQLKDQSSKLDSQKQQKKVIRYEQKVPQEYLAIQAKNQALKKEIKKIAQKYEAEKAEMDKLVPPSVIQNMNKKISVVISTNQKVAQISKIIQQVSKQNQKLSVQIDGLEWGQNVHLKNLENDRKRQEQKNKALQQELFLKKKQLQQLSFKLDQYVKEYPDFKPEKKKKPEPQPQPPKNNKKEQKGSKKNDKSPPADKKKQVDSVIEPKVQQVKVEEPKVGKNKKKKVTASQIVQVKDPSPPPVQIKVEKNKVEVKQQYKSEIKPDQFSQKIDQKGAQGKPKKKKK